MRQYNQILLFIVSDNRFNFDDLFDKDVYGLANDKYWQRKILFHFKSCFENEELGVWHFHDST